MTEYVSLSEIAGAAGVQVSAVSNWRARHSDFPSPSPAGGPERYDAGEIAHWLDARRIPRNRLNPGEVAGVSYGDRFRRSMGIDPTASGTSAPSQGMTTHLWKVINVLRDRFSTEELYEYLYELIHLRLMRPELWRSVVAASSWPRMRELMDNASVEGVSLFASFMRMEDSALLAAVSAVDAIDLSDGRGPNTTAAQISEYLLDNLDRRHGKGESHFTSPALARCLTEIVAPQPGETVYDPACGSGEFLVAVEQYMRSLDGEGSGARLFGQYANKRSLLRSRINLDLHGSSAKLVGSGDAVQADRFDGREFDVVLANPPFGLRLNPVPRPVWPYGELPEGSAVFAWLQVVLTRLRPGGRAAVILSDSAAFLRQTRAVAIRRNLVEAGVVECVIGLPQGMFRFTGVRTMIWVLRSPRARPAERGILAVDARALGRSDRGDRRVFEEQDIRRISGIYKEWHQHRTVSEVGELARFVEAAELEVNEFDLSPGRYVRDAGVPDQRELATEVDQLRSELTRLGKAAAEATVRAEESWRELAVREIPDGETHTVPLGKACYVLAGPGDLARTTGTAESPSGTPVVLPRNVGEGSIKLGGLDLTESGTAARMHRYRLKTGDIVSVRKGTLGRYGLVEEAQDGWLLGPGCLLLRPGGTVLSAYLLHYLSGEAARAWLENRVSGAVVPHIRSSTLREMPIPLPPLSWQASIAKALSLFRDVEVFHREISSTTALLRTKATGLLAPGPVT